MKNKNAKIVFKTSSWSGVSKAAKNIVQRMLLKNPEERLSVEEAINHPWIQYHLGNKNYLQTIFNFVGLNQFIDIGEPILTYTKKTERHSVLNVKTQPKLNKIKKLRQKKIKSPLRKKKSNKERGGRKRRRSRKRSTLKKRKINLTVSIGKNRSKKGKLSMNIEKYKKHKKVNKKKKKEKKSENSMSIQEIKFFKRRQNRQKAARQNMKYVDMDKRIRKS